jgi:hypothetical protein
VRLSSTTPDPQPYKGFRDKEAHDRAHELMALPSWHPDAPTGGMRHVLKKALRLCRQSPGYCDYESPD